MLPIPPRAFEHEAVFVEGWVTKGNIGVGICSETGSEIADERRLASSGSARPFRVELLRPADVDAKLVVRTTNAPIPGEVIITKMGTMQAPSAVDAWREVPVAPHAWCADWHLHFGQHSESLTGRVRIGTLRRAGDVIDVPWFGGVLKLDPRAEITRAIAGSGTYEPGLLWALAHVVRTGDAILMAGANAGVVPAFLAHLTGAEGLVIAAEPSPREFLALQQNVAQLEFGLAIRTVNAALGAHAGLAGFSEAPRESSGRGSVSDSGDLLQVEVTTIDALADVFGRPLDMLFLDIEGCELDALDGADRTIKKDQPVIVTEIEGAAACDAASARLAEGLGALGYILLVIETGSGASDLFPTVPSGASWALLAIPPRLQSGDTIEALTHRRRLGLAGSPDWVNDNVHTTADDAYTTFAAPDVPWEYLAEWGVPDIPGNPRATDVIEVTASAEGGPAELAVVDRTDGRITDVAVIPPDPTKLLITLSPREGGASQSLILRTGSTGGTRARLQRPYVVRRAPPLNPVLRSGDRNLSGCDSATDEGPDGIDNFTDDLAEQINRARLEWLDSLQLEVTGRRVVDFGAGVGMFAPFFVERGARYVGMEGREENVRAARRLVPDAEFVQADLRGLRVESLPADMEIGLIFGLLYHLDDPRDLLDTLGDTATRLLIIETQVCDAELAVLLAQREPRTRNQALDGRGSRPSVQWLLNAVRDAGFPCIASTAMPVNHPDFTFESLDDGAWRRNGHNLRVAFVAGRDALDLPGHLAWA